MKIVLITSYFPPDAHIGAYRWGRLGKALIEKGHEFHVVSGENSIKPHLTFCPQQGDYDVKPCTISRIAYPAKCNFLHWCLRLTRIPGALLSRYNSIAGNALADKGEGPSERLSFQMDIRMRKIQKVMRERIFFPHFSWEWGRRAAIYAEKTMEMIRMDAIIGTHPFPGTLRAAAYLSEKYHVPWVADMRDPFHNDVQLADLKMGKRLLPIEVDLLHKASAVVTINRHLAKMLKTRKKVHVIPNGFERTSRLAIAADKDRRLSPAPPYRLVYTGQINDGANYLLFFNSLCASKMTGLSKPLAKIDYFGNYYYKIKPFYKTLRENGVEMENHGFVSTEKCRAAQSEADFLIVFGWSGPGDQCVMTGKVFEYLPTEKPILAIARRDSALGEFILETGAGFVLESEKEIIGFLHTLAEVSGVSRPEIACKRNQDAIDEYSVDSTSAKYERLLYKVVAQSSCRR